MLTFVLALAACSDDSGAESTGGGEAPTTAATIDGSPSTAPPTTSTTTTTTVTGPAGVPDSFARTLVEIDGTSYNVAVADTQDKQQRGLMGVEELDPLDGMLFTFGSERERTFWMKDTLIPLDIAFFDADGFLVSVTSMETCLDGDCPNYPSNGPAQFALEVPRGVFADLAIDARLVIIGPLGGNGKEI